jgi:hypothetical protein
MANDKIYPIDMGTKDILLQNEGGGGMIMNDQFIGIVGNMLPNQKELLDGQDNVNGTNIQTDKFSSNIIITNTSSNPVGMSDLASKNFDSLDQSIGTNQVVAPSPKEHCGGEGFKNYEFQEAAQNFSLWEEINSDGGDTKLAFNSNNNYLKTEDQLNKLLFSKTSIDVIKGIISLDNSSFKNLGWGKYGSGSSDLSKSVLNFYGDYFQSNEKNNLGKDVKNTLKYFKNNAVNKNEVRSVFDIQTLPSGLRIMALQNCYNSGDKWINRILTTMGPNRLNVLNGLFGITIEQSKTGGTGALPPDEKAKKFFDQYDDIINTYNEDKSKFLQTLATETKEWYGRLVDQGGDKRYKQQNKAFKDFYNVYVDIALAIALKYANCPDEYEVIGNVPTSPTPSPSVTPTTSSTPPTPTKAEEEGIYNAEFLPVSDDPGAALFDGDYGDTCSAAVEKAKNDISNKRFDSKDLKNFGGGLPPDFSNIDLVKELDTYIQFSSQARDDYDNGIINPNTILDLLRIGKGAKIKIYVSTARKGHSCETTSGNLSRHMKGYGLDLGGFYDLNGVIAASNKMITSSASTASGVPANFKTIADKFVSTASQLEGASRSEVGNDRGILWYFNEKSKGGNHFNHVHYSNQIRYSGWAPKTIPSSFNCDCTKVRSSGLTAENC